MRKRGGEVEERNYAKVALSKKELSAIVDAVGDVATLLNTRHRVAKEQGWRDEPPSKAAFIRAALEDNNLLRRPILVVAGRAVVGKDESALGELLAKR